MRLIFINRGDTIVEVLLSIAIAGLAITGAYGVTTHSLQEGISAAERTEANKLAESQIESLKFREKTDGPTWAASYTDPPNPPGQGFSNIPSSASFCLDSSALSPTLASGSVNPAWLPQTNTGTDHTVLTTDASASPTNHYSSSCGISEGGAEYFIDMEANGTSLRGQAFLVTIRWNAPGNGPEEQSQLYYKLPPAVLTP